MIASLDDVADATTTSVGLAGEVLDVADALDAQYMLRRSLSEPNAEAAQRGHLVEQLLGPRLSQPALALVKAAAERSWPSSEALAQAVRDEGVRLAWRAAVADKSVEQARYQVLAMNLVGTVHQGVAPGLADEARSVADKTALVTSLVGADAPVAKLLARCGLSDKRQTFAANLSGYLDALAALRGHQRARVTTAIPLEQRQADELQTQLTRIYGTPIDLEPVVDARVVGGVRVDAGGDVIDGSIKARLDAAHDAIANVTQVSPAVAASKEEHND